MSVTFVTWKWSQNDNGRQFESAYVNVLARQVHKHYPRPHRFVCITDEPAGLDQTIEHVPMPATGLEHLLNPQEIRRRERASAFGFKGSAPNRPFPSCYRRLWNFSADARGVLGNRIFALDIDVIVCGDLRPLVDRSNATFIGWSDPRFGWDKVAGGCYLLRTGAHTDVWTDFDPVESPKLCASRDSYGSDQSWMSYKLFPPPDRWSSIDGVLKLNWLDHGRHAFKPEHARLVFTSGDRPPWSLEQQMQYPWIKDHWSM